MAVSRSALLVVALVFVAFGIAPSADQHHDPGWHWHGASPMYNPQTEASFTGIVKAVNRVPASGQYC
jgi:hypothetical protein